MLSQITMMLIFEGVLSQPVYSCSETNVQTRDICITSEISLVLLSYNKQRVETCESGLYWHESMKRGEPEANGRGVVFI